MPELSIYQEAAIATVALLLVVLLVQRRRRARPAEATAGAPSPMAAATPSAPAGSRFRLRRKSDTPNDAPRGRRRRRLAHEAAAATGVAATELPAREIEAVAPVTEVEAFVPAPVAEPTPAEQPTGEIPLVTVVPLVEGDVLDRDGDVVAHPGWPAPGELATGYDPDAFDPVPEAGSEGEAEAGEPEPVEDDHPGADDEILVLPDDDPVDEPPVTVDVEALEWQSLDETEFDPATGWGSDESELPSWDDGTEAETVAWSIEEAAGEAGEADLAFDAEPAGEVEAEAVEDDEAVEDEGPALDWEELPSPWSEPEAIADEPVEDVAAPVGLLDYELPAVTGEDVSATPAQMVGPVVLELGSLGPDGEAIELVIEPAHTAEGIRLRLTPRGEIKVLRGEDEDGTPLSDRERQALDELDELLGGLQPIQPAAATASAAEAHADFGDVPFLTGGPAPSNGHHAETNGHHPGHDAVEDPDDTAAILADIRACLADLDARRAERDANGATAGLS